MRTTVDLPDGLYRQLKARAALGGLKVRELIARYLEQGLQSPLESPSGPPRSEPPVAIKRTGRPIRALTRAQLRRLDEADEVARHARSARR
jgi:hypothetical protein